MSKTDSFIEIWGKLTAQKGKDFNDWPGFRQDLQELMDSNAKDFAIELLKWYSNCNLNKEEAERIMTGYLKSDYYKQIKP